MEAQEGHLPQRYAGVLPSSAPRTPSSSLFWRRRRGGRRLAPGLPSLAGCTPNSSLELGAHPAGRSGHHLANRAGPTSPRPGPARTCGLSRGRSSSWEAPPMVCHRSLTIFRQDWRGRPARRAAAERKDAGVGAGSGRVLPARSPRRYPAPGGPGQRACVSGGARVRTGCAGVRG